MKNLLSIKQENIINYNIFHIQKIINKLFDNFQNLIDNESIFIIGKLIRKIIKNNNLLYIVLNLNIFQILINYSKSNNFIIAKECIKILFFIFNNQKIDLNILSKYIEDNEENISFLFFKDIIDNNNYYFLTREILILLYTIYNNTSFEKFNEKSLNNIQNLKSIMILLNNESEQIRTQSLFILYMFFNDIEYKTIQIKKLLYINKNNFLDYFNNLPDTKVELSEKKNFILFELERLDNLLNE